MPLATTNPAPVQDEADLIARTRGGDATALEAIYRAHATRILTVATRLLDSRADAEDVLHDLFVGLPEALRRYEHRGHFGAWLGKVAVRMSLMRMRSGRRRGEVDLDAARDVAKRDDSARAAAHDALELAIASLSPALRAVFVLREIEGFTHQEIAAVLRISTSASEARLSRATAAIRKRLGGDR